MSTAGSDGQPLGGLPVKLPTHVTDGGVRAQPARPCRRIPERSFSHPLPGDRTLAQGADDRPARAAARRGILSPGCWNTKMLHAITWSRWRSVQACTRLTYQAPDDAVVGLPELLWHTAVRIEMATGARLKAGWLPPSGICRRP